jgi:aspartyl-tRNA(Asn)/glutamyl-tRNA(Gln) amidotransferase subunit B
LEVHAQIASKSKLFSSSPTAFGAAPNSQVSLVDVAFPGMLPVLNQTCVLQALKTSLALEGRINLKSFFDRKNYFYPDLPQGYQISQFYTPIMQDGQLTIEIDGEVAKTIRIARLHIEQDAGKSIHGRYPEDSAVDLNRAGVGLMEIVSQPDLTSPEEAGAYVRKLRTLLVCLGSSDGNMEEGSLRVDANVSVALPGEPLGTRVEVKNLNSVRFMQQAIALEAQRQIAEIEAGRPVVQQTRLFDEASRTTRAMREKEDEQQYRYFPDPDVPPLVLDQKFVDDMRQALPELPDAKKARFQKEHGLSAYDAGVLVVDIAITRFFEDALVYLKQATPKVLANWIMGSLMAALNREAVSLKDHSMTPARLVGLIERVASGQLSNAMAKEVFEASWTTGEAPAAIIEAKGLAQISSAEELSPLVEALLAAEADKVTAYRAGKDKLFGYFVGQMMQKTAGKGNPTMINQLLREKLDNKD